MRRRGPRPLAGALDRLTADLAPATPLAAVQRVWSSGRAGALRETAARPTASAPA